MKNISLTAWIIDDEESCSTLLQMKLNHIAPAVTITGIFSGAIKLTKEIDLPDVVFLDIEMPNIDGIQFARELQDKAMVIFTTAHTRYGIPAVKLQALEYLLKPINDEELAEAVGKLEEKIIRKRQDLNLVEEPLKNKIAIPTNETIFIVQVENIIFVEALNNCSKFMLAEGKPIVVAKTLKSVEQLLGYYKNFFRSHKSYLANLHYVSRLDIKGESGLLIMKNGERIVVSRDKKKELIMLLHQRLLK